MNINQWPELVDHFSRCLDQLYETGVSELYQQLSVSVVKHLNLSCEGLNLDSTSFHLDGEYSHEEDSKAIHITRGYSRDHRPELNQVILNLITENKAGIPIYMQAASGNTNDSEGFKQIVKHHLGSMKAAQNNRYFIGDSALYVAETIQSLDQQGQLFISRAPQKLKAVRQAISEQHTLSFIQLENGYSGAWLKVNYAGIEQRWLLVHSEQAQKSELKTLDKKMLRESSAASKSFKKLTRQRFSCPSDAVGALTIWKKANPCIELSDVSTAEHGIFKQSGRPKKGQEPDSMEYQLTGNLSSPLALRVEQVQQKGFFMLATNDCMFRSNPITDFGINRSPVSVLFDHPFRDNPVIFGLTPESMIG